MYKILVINPGSTSTEISLFEDEREVKSARIVHPVEKLRAFDRVIDQLPYRNDVIKVQLAGWAIRKGDLSAVVGRSSILKKVEGSYLVNQKMANDAREGKMKYEHAALLGCLLAKEIGENFGIPAFVAHLVSDEFPSVAGVSGIPQIKRRPVYHVQNIKPVAAVVAHDLKKDIKNVSLVIAHLEGGMSITAFKEGKVIDSTSAFDEGPFTTERSGSLPGVPLVELCFSGKYTKGQILKSIRGEGGMTAYLGTNKMGEVESRIEKGDSEAIFYMEAMCYQVAKDIGAMATVLKGKVDAIILTGKILDSKKAVDWIKERVGFIAPVKTYPEQEALVLARAGLRVLTGAEKAREYD
jgi:butyrate kinase